MEILHFTTGSLDPNNVRRHGTVANMPLASGQGHMDLSCLYLSPGVQIAVAPANHAQFPDRERPRGGDFPQRHAPESIGRNGPPAARRGGL